MTDDQPPVPAEPTPDGPAARPVRSVGRMVRIGCAVLGVLGAFSTIIGITTIADPERGVCTQARSMIDEANDDDEEGNDVDLGDAADADDLDCDEAIPLAEDIPDEELVSESGVRTLGMILTGIGIAQVVTSLLVLRTMDRRARLGALAAAALGIIFSPLGLLGIPLIGFVVYALQFSADARAIFGGPGRRPPAPTT